MMIFTLMGKYKFIFLPISIYIKFSCDKIILVMSEDEKTKNDSLADAEGDFQGSFVRKGNRKKCFFVPGSSKNP